MKIFNRREKLKEEYSKYPGALHLGSTTVSILPNVHDKKDVLKWEKIQ